MTKNSQRPDITELKPRITVFGVGGGGGNAVNNMIAQGLKGVDFVVANTDAQALSSSKAQNIIQLGVKTTQGLGAGAMPEIGAEAAEECLNEIEAYLADMHMLFVAAGMGGGTGTGAAPVVARIAREKGILTVGVVTKPFSFEGAKRMKTAEAGIEELQKVVDTLIVIPNQNLFRIANEKTTFEQAFGLADQVLYSGVASITDLMIKDGLINLDFADVRSVMHEMGRAMMGTGEASGEGRALAAAEAAIANPLLDETSMTGARGLLISISGGKDMTLYEVDEATNRIRQEVDADANVIFGAISDENLDGILRVSVVATGLENAGGGSQSSENLRYPASDSEGKNTQSLSKKAGSFAPATQAIKKAYVEQPSQIIKEKTADHAARSAVLSDVAQQTVLEQKMQALRSAVPLQEEKPHLAPYQPVGHQVSGVADSFLSDRWSVDSLRLNASSLPPLEDFPSIAQKQMQVHHSLQAPSNSVQKLFNKLANFFNREKEEKDLHHAPVSSTRQRRPSKAVSFTGTAEAARRSLNVEPLSYQDSSVEDLEIPTFLRQHVN